MNSDLYEKYFAHIPENLKISSDVRASSALNEAQVIREIKNKENTIFKGVSFAGYGAYSHFISEAVHHLSSLRNFVTSYTPYQPEVAQGTLQAVYEYQGYLSSLTGMDVSNASLYDGATSLVEAIRMALRMKNPSEKKAIILISKGVHKSYIRVVETYFSKAIKDFLNIEIHYVDLNSQSGSTDWEKIKISGEIHSIIFQNPNMYGILEKNLDNLKHQFPNAQILYGTNELHSLTILPEPKIWNTDIVWGEAQSLGIPVSFGGPYLGFISAKDKYLRQMPGRLIGRTTGETPDGQKTDAYVITLSTREQHIRREKATSNICSNQSLVALRAGIYMAYKGWEGMKDTMNASLCHAKEILERIKKEKPNLIAFPDGEYFHEIALQIPANQKEDEIVHEAVHQYGIIPGVIKDGFIVSYFSDIHDHNDLEKYWQWIKSL